jgi:hypothetical protein
MMRRASRLLPNGISKPLTRPCQLPITVTFRSRPQTLSSTTSIFYTSRHFSAGLRAWKEDYADKAKKLNQKGLDKQEDGFHSQIDNAIGEAKELQARTPWHREGADQPPVKRARSAGAMTKGLFSFSK